MSTIHFIGGEKGGVGKSVTARLLVQYLIDHNFSFAGLDADTSQGSLLRYYKDFAHATNLSSLVSADQIMDRALGADRRVVVDLPAQSAKLLHQWMAAGNVPGFAAEMDVRLVFWHVTDGGYESIHELERVTQDTTENVSYVVVRNFGRSQSFDQLDASPALERVSAAGGRIIDLPALDGATMYEIDRIGASFWAAVNSTADNFSLSPMARRRTKQWLADCYTAIESLGPML